MGGGRLAVGVLAVLVLGSVATDALGAVFCKTRKGAVFVRDSKCRRRETPLPNVGLVGAAGPAGTEGAKGADGPPGADGQLRIYGDGSAGAKTLAADATLADANLQYTDFTVNAGVTLTVESGTTIRCTGTFTNRGTIVVGSGARASEHHAFVGTTDGTQAPAHPGVALRSAGVGELGATGVLRAGGQSGLALSAFQARQLVRPGATAGGAGASRYGGGLGAAGGGSLVVLGGTAVVHADGATITAAGADGGIGQGGGAGGIVILASKGSVTSAGTIDARGGGGGPSNVFAGVGGGGGGGIVHFLAPTVIAPGTVTVTGGTAGVAGAAGSVTATPHQGGGGGGASGGNGGDGGSISLDDTPNAGGDGAAGLSLTTSADPTALF
jgi:hypothetical protein